MLRRDSEQLKLFIGGASGVDESLATKRERIERLGEAQAFEFEGNDDDHEDLIALGSHVKSLHARGKILVLPSLLVKTCGQNAFSSDPFASTTLSTSHSRPPSVVLLCGNKRSILARDEIEVLL